MGKCGHILEKNRLEWVGVGESGSEWVGIAMGGSEQVKVSGS